MPYDIDTETAETKSGKPVKRVRFSDEVQNVYDCAGSDDNSGSISLENESNKSHIKSSVGVESSDFYTKESMKYDGSVSNADDVNRSVSDNYVNKVIELPSYYTENVNEPANAFPDDIISQGNENSVNDAEECIPSGSNSVTNDMDELIHNTMHMTISPVKSAIPPNHFLSSEESSLFSTSSETNPERVQAIVQPSEQKNCVTSLSRKRSLEGMLIEKQTSKLNICLMKSSSKISSADELKNAVYNAWYKVKNEKSPTPSSQLIPEVKKTIDTSQKTTTHDAYETWKRSKRKAKKMSPTKKMSYKVSEPVSPKTKEEIEESKMAFRAWKKKKDELLRHQLAEKCRKEERERLDSLMNERIRKNDAESAFSAWNAHKSVVIKMERKKNQWLSEKEREKLDVKMKKGEEAEQIYYDWLKNKVCSSKSSTCKMIEDKPPWTPPGKVNSLL